MPFTEEQTAMRRTGFTATDMRDLIGEGYRSATEVVLSKLQDPVEVEEEPTVETEAMELGTALEPWLLERHARRNDLCVCVDTGPAGGTIRSGVHTRALATPDGLVMPQGPPGAVMPLSEWQGAFTGFPVAVEECKTTGLASGAAFGAKKWGEAGTNAVPRSVAAQATWQMGVTEVGVCHIPVLIGNVGYREYRLEFSPDLWSLMLEVCDEAWEKYVVPGTLPDDPGPSKGATAAITKWFDKAEDKGLVLESTPDLTEAALDLQSSMEAQKALSERVAALKNRFRGVIGNAYAVEGSFGKIIWTLPTSRKKLDKDRMIDLLVERTGFGETALETLRTECTTKTEGNRTLRAYWNEGE